MEATEALPNLSAAERRAVLKLCTEEEAARAWNEVWTESDWDESLYQWRNESIKNDSGLSEHEEALLEAYRAIAAERAAQEEAERAVTLKPMKESAVVTKRLVTMPSTTKAPLPKPQMAGVKSMALGISSALSTTSNTAQSDKVPIPGASNEKREKTHTKNRSSTTEHEGHKEEDRESVPVPKRAKKAGKQEIHFTTARSSAPEDAIAVWNDISAPPPDDGLLQIDNTEEAKSTQGFWPYLELPRYGSNTTLVLQVSVDAEADRWALNVCPKHHDDAANILLHLNARRIERGGVLVLNDKLEDNWGRAEKVPLSNFPLPLFGLDQTTLILQLHVDYNQLFVDVHLNQKPIVRWPSRLAAPPNGADLAILVPTADDFGNPETITIHSAWWGWHAPLTPPPHANAFRGGHGRPTPF